MHSTDSEFFTYDTSRRAVTTEKLKRHSRLFSNQSQFTYDTSYSQQLKEVTAQSQKLRLSLLHERQRLLKYHGTSTPYNPQKNRISLYKQQSESPKDKLSIRKKQTLLRKIENELKKADPQFNISKYLKTDKQLLFQPTKRIPAYQSPKKKKNTILLQYYKSKETNLDSSNLEIGEARRIKWARIKEKRKQTIAAQQINDTSIVIRKLQIKTDKEEDTFKQKEKLNELKRQKSPLSILFSKYKDEVQNLYGGSSDRMKNLFDFYKTKPEVQNKIQKTEKQHKRDRIFSLTQRNFSSVDSPKRFNSTCLDDSQQLLESIQNSLIKQGQKIGKELKKNIFINLKLRQETKMLEGPPNLQDQITVRKFIKGPNYLCEIVRLMSKDDPKRNLKEYEFLYNSQNYSQLPEQKMIHQSAEFDNSFLQI